MSGHDELTAERRHLAYVRQCLTDSREESRRKAEQAAKRGDDDGAFWFSRNAWQLDDRESSPLFFGRLDGPEPDPIYVGRRYVSDTSGTPVTIDWRTPMAARFYRASEANPMEVVRRRRYGFSIDNEMTGFDDELLGTPCGADELSSLVRLEIERAHFGPMRDIVATIQPDQDHIIRLGMTDALVVQGGPGTGKTAVGLHRAAYLLFEYARIRNQGVLVVGPNDTFIRYIARVLPALGEVQTNHESLAGLVGAKLPRPEEEPRAALIKADARMAVVLERAVRRVVSMPTEDLVITQTSPYVRVSLDELRSLTTDVMREARPFLDAREQLSIQVAELVRRRVEARGRTLTDGEVKKISRCRQTKTLVEHVWPKIKPQEILFRLLTDPDHLAECADGVLTPQEQKLLSWPTPPATAGRAKWTMGDYVLLDELSSHLAPGRRFGHLVIDEAQDLSAMQWRAVARRCSGSATLLGDLAQRTTPGSLGSWQEVLSGLGLPGVINELRTSFRVPRQILGMANRLLEQIDPDLPKSTSARSVADAVTIVSLEDEPEPRTAVSRAGRISEILKEIPPEQGSIGVIVTDPDVDTMRAELLGMSVDLTTPDQINHERRVALVPASQAKGLEFDHVILVEPQDILSQGQHGQRLLYISITRAISRLTIVHQQTLPPALHE
ncbi:HelD family protein [Lentzea kentuckyensis]|uniref:HelD family protein n=1 Tax=Lentzea kentuckyensis TaxID=360086 RepID=UPI0013022A12|nr:3'-5' exonuclease [Lentzea kentuckyensis]